MSSFDKMLELGREVLGVRSAQHEVHASNIANAKSENYQAKIPSFSIKLDRAREMLKNSVPGMNEKSPWKVEVKVENSKDRPEENGNNVKLDREISKLSENSLNYMAALKILSRQIATQKYAIMEGK